MARTMGFFTRSSDRLSWTSTTGSPTNRGANQRARIERRVFERLDETGARSAERAWRAMLQNVPGNAALAADRMVDAAIPSKRSARKSFAGRAVNVVEHRLSRHLRRSCPVPFAERGFERLIAEIAIEIAVAGPAQHRGLQRDLDACARRNGMPEWRSARRGRRRGRPVARPYRHATFDPGGKRHGDLVDIDGQRVVLPSKRARPDASAMSSLVRSLRVRSVSAQCFDERP